MECEKGKRDMMYEKKGIGSRHTKNMDRRSDAARQKGKKNNNENNRTTRHGMDNLDPSRHEQSIRYHAFLLRLFVSREKKITANTHLYIFQLSGPSTGNNTP